MGNSGDEIDLPQKNVFSLEVTDVKYEVQKGTVRSDVKDDKNNHQEAGFHNMNSKYGDLTNSQRLDLTGTNHIENVEGPKESEKVVTCCVSHTRSSFEGCQDPDLELATAGIDLLASVAISESSSNDETVSPIVRSRSPCMSERDMVSEEGEIRSFPHEKTIVEDEMVDSLHNAERKVAKRQEFDVIQSALPSLAETETKQDYEADEKPGVQLDEDATAFTVSKDVSTGPTVGGLSKADDSSAYLALPLINESKGRDFVQTSISMVQTYSTDDGVAMNQEQISAKIVDPGQATSRVKDTELREHDGSLDVGFEEFTEVALKADKSENDLKISHREKSLGMNIIKHHICSLPKESTNVLSISEHQFEAVDGEENHHSLNNIANDSASTTLLSQPSTGYTNLNRKQEQMMVKCIDGKKLDQIMGASGDMALDIQDESQNYIPGQQQIICGELLSQQNVHSIVLNSESKSMNQILEIEEATKGNDHSQRFERLDFDLNEQLVEEISVQDAVPTCAITASKHVPVTASRGLFIHPESCIQSTEDHGLKDSIVTSAFDPEGVDHVAQTIHSIAESSISDAISIQNSKPSRQPLNIDLNVADEQNLEDVGRSFQFSLGINMHDSCSTRLKDINEACKSETSSQTRRPILDLNHMDGLDEGESVPGSTFEADKQENSQALQRCKNNKLALDLNDIPVIEIVDEPTPPARNVRPLSRVVGPKMTGSMGNIFCWPQQATNTYSTTTSPAFASISTESVYASVSAGPRGIPFYGDNCNSSTTLSSSTINYSPQNFFRYGGHSFGFNDVSFPSVSVQHGQSSRSPALTAVPLQWLSSESDKSLCARYSHATGIREMKKFTGEGAGARSSDLNAGPNALEMVKARENILNGSQLTGGVGGSKRPYHQVIEVLGGPTEGEGFKKWKEMEAAAWGVRKKIFPTLKQQTWR